ncbi:MAG TPA: hypothetical protein VKP30_29135 [Polyangiaceae bacterium]|nr:hypothetical protein [Polyangiaceae bacterium]
MKRASTASTPTPKARACFINDTMGRLVLEIAKKSGHAPLGTFDRDLGKVDGAVRL